MDANRTAYEREAEVYSNLSLMRPEQKFLSIFGGRWHEIDVLDVGIGSGRTTYSFGAIARRYVGIDYSSKMVGLAKQLIGSEDGNIELLEADARDLSAIEGRFDFVLFSFNGLDSVGHEDRLKILSELRRVIRPDGHFLFSAHSMNVLPMRAKRPTGGHRSRLHALYAWVKYARTIRRARRVNKSLELEVGRERGWMLVRDGAHNFELEVYYVDPKYQVEQLRDAGFNVTAIYDLSGQQVQPESPGPDPWLHYHCRPAS